MEFRWIRTRPEPVYSQSISHENLARRKEGREGKEGKEGKERREGREEGKGEEGKMINWYNLLYLGRK